VRPLEKYGFLSLVVVEFVGLGSGQIQEWQGMELGKMEQGTRNALLQPERRAWR
jgi:hypothetical protein